MFQLLDSSGSGGVPSIPKLQELLECAWREGFDPAGCEQLGGKVVNTRYTFVDLLYNFIKVVFH